MENLTYNDLPGALTQLCQDMAFVKRYLLEKSNEVQTDPDRWLDLTELCEYHPDKPSKPTVYGWVHSGLIPCHKGQGQKKLRFLKSEIDFWIKQGRRKTTVELEAETDEYLSQKKRG